MNIDHWLRSIKEFPTNVWKSIFRHSLPSTDYERAATSFTNFFLHIHPVKVHKHTLRPSFSMGLGLISFFLFVILVVTGVLLMFYYVPSTTQAYDRMLDLRGSVAFGTFLRNMHRWSAHGMVAAVFLHMCRVFFTGSYKKPREFNWVLGIFLFLLTLFASFTGYLLPWDQLAFWAITVGTAIAGYAPVIGKGLQFLLLGDTVVGQEALLRFYVLHVAFLPIAMTMLIMVHFWRIRKDGGLSRPAELDLSSTPALIADNNPESTAALPALATTSNIDANQLINIERKRFGIQGLVRMPFAKQNSIEDKDTLFSWPHLFMAELFVFVLTVAGVLIVSLYFNAPLEEPVNIMHPPNPAKAPWYFLGLQEMVSYSAFWGGIGIPGLEVLLLLLLPYIDRNPEGVGVWFSRKRLLANTLFITFVVINIVLMIIGTFFRGANWEFVSPW